MTSKLPKAPLQEVIFEVRWELDINPLNNQTTDQGFDLAAGVLRNLLGKDFIAKRIVPSDIPAQLLLYKPVHQFRAGEEQWPVIQLGPGIFTVNETEKNYEWKSNYFPLLQRGLNLLEQAYDNPLKFNYASLRYIDSVKVADYGEKNWADFIHKNINFRFENKYDTRGSLKLFQFDQMFDMEDGSVLHIAFSSGKSKNNEDLFIWQTAVIKSGSFKKDELTEWADNAHEHTSSLFKEISNKDFYGSFTKAKS